MNACFLPMSKNEMALRGWNQLDILLITGDAYVDHPAWGAAVIGRVLEAQGFRVGIISQPDWRDVKDFLVMGIPKLFVGITSGNVDSLIANYTANKLPRSEDDFSYNGKAGKRPDRAVLVYAHRARQAFGKIPLILGGIEASLRRLAHYDYWSDTVKRSVLVDAKADMLVYGMGETQITQIARRLNDGEKINDINNIRGTCFCRKSADFLIDSVRIPSFEEVKADKQKFIQAFIEIYDNQDPFTARPIIQAHADWQVIHLPPAMPFIPRELDKIYELPYTRQGHPSYQEQGGVPGLETVKFSLISHRGCCGQCYFCGLYFHQGRIVQNRTPESLIKEAEKLSNQHNFNGTITDIGGPTANMYLAHCSAWETAGACKNKNCCVPQVCSNLKLEYEKNLQVYAKIKTLPKVKHVFISSGFRHDLLISPQAQNYFETICRYYIGGQIKVAPEHIVDNVLCLMNKPPEKTYEQFLRCLEKINAKLDKKIYIANYFICGYPGTGIAQAAEMAQYFLNRNMCPEQVQDFIPIPMTAAGCMYHTRTMPLTNEKIYVPFGGRERRLHRALAQYKNADKQLIEEALTLAGRRDLLPRFINAQEKRNQSKK